MAHGNSTPISGVLLGDQGSSSIEGSDKIYLLVDTNGDGDAADEGERIVFFDETNAEGLGGEDGSPTGNILNIGQSSTDGSVYAGDGDTDAVYRLKDLNGDGDANDAGESTVWFSEADNAAGFTLPTPKRHRGRTGRRHLHRQRRRLLPARRRDLPDRRPQRRRRCQR